MPAEKTPLTNLPAATRRTFLALVGSLGVSGALAACGGDSGGLDAGGGGGEGGKPTLKQWYHLYGESGTEQAVKRYAEGYDKATVQVQWTPGDYESKLSSGLLSDTGPDVFEYNLNVDMVRSGQVVPLDDIIDPVRDDYSETVLTATSLEGSTYGVKIVDDTGFLYYRKSLLAAAGVQPPTTMDELIDATRALDRDGVKGLFIGNDAGVTPSFGGGSMLDIILWSAGTASLTPDNKVGFTTPEAKESFRKFRALAETGSILLGAPTDFWDPSSFTQGLCAMQWTGLWAMPKILETFGDDVGIVPWPAHSATVGTPVTFLGGWTSMVSGKAQDVELAKDYVKWLWIDNTEAQEDFNLSYGFHIPPRKSIATGAEKLQTGLPAEALRIFTEHAQPPNPMWTPKMRSAFADAATAIVREGADVDASLATAQAAVEAELARLTA